MQNTKLKISQKFHEITKTKILQPPYSYTISRLLLTSPLPSAIRFYNVVQQCYFEMKTNTEPYFSILSSTIQWSTTTPVLNLALTQLVNPISYRYACFVAFWFKEIKNNLVTKQAVLVDGPKKLLSYQRRH